MLIAAVNKSIQQKLEITTSELNFTDFIQPDNHKDDCKMSNKVIKNINSD